MTVSKYIHTLFLTVTGLALWHWQSESRRHHRLQREAAAAKPAKEAVPIWEGEGGALVGSGSQLGPEPRKA